MSRQILLPLGVLVSIASLSASGWAEPSRSEPPRSEPAPLEWGEIASFPGSPAGAPQFQFESFGRGTLKLRVKAIGSLPVQLVITSPDRPSRSPRSGGTPRQEIFSPGAPRTVEFSLAAQGLWQLQFSGGPAELRATCEGLCSRPQVPISALARELRDSGKLALLLDQAKEQLQGLIPDAALRASLLAELEQATRDSDFKKLDRFPIVPLKQASLLRAALGGLGAKDPSNQPAQAVAPLSGALEDLLGACDATRPENSPVHPQLPEIRYGHFPNLGLGPCQVDRSIKLARILSALASDNGSSVTYRSEKLTTPAALIGALIDSGHRVELRNERTHANFLSLQVRDRDGKWPVWIDTGIQLPDSAKTLVIPMGHSQHAWRISGPLVNARVTFFLGIYGVGFFPQVDQRPGWTGMKTPYRWSSDREEERALILKALEVATLYTHRNQIERATVARGLPADGYGYLGVCNDSTALLELLTQGTISVYPLTRARELDRSVRLRDGLDEALAKLPHDADELPEPREAIRRIFAMLPYPIDSPEMVDEELREDLKRLPRP